MGAAVQRGNTHQQSMILILSSNAETLAKCQLSTRGGPLFQTPTTPKF